MTRKPSDTPTACWKVTPPSKSGRPTALWGGSSATPEIRPQAEPCLLQSLHLWTASPNKMELDMNPARDTHGRADGLRPDDNQPSEEALADVRPAESRSWEPPCWPSDGWDCAVLTPRRAIGWRGG